MKRYSRSWWGVTGSHSRQHDELFCSVDLAFFSLRQAQVAVDLVEA